MFGIIRKVELHMHWFPFADISVGFLPRTNLYRPKAKMLSYLEYVLKTSEIFSLKFGKNYPITARSRLNSI